MIIERYRRRLLEAEKILHQLDASHKDGADCECTRHLSQCALVDHLEQELQRVERTTYNECFSAQQK